MAITACSKRGSPMPGMASSSLPDRKRGLSMRSKMRLGPAPVASLESVMRRAYVPA